MAIKETNEKHIDRDVALGFCKRDHLAAEISFCTLRNSKERERSRHYWRDQPARDNGAHLAPVNRIDGDPNGREADNCADDGVGGRDRPSHESSQPSANVPAARSADSMPNTRSFGRSTNIAESTMPLRMVEVTSPPARVSAGEFKYHGDKNGLSDGQRLGADRGSHCIGYIICADTPGHKKAGQGGNVIIRVAPYSAKNSIVLVPESYCFPVGYVYSFYFARSNSTWLPISSAVSARPPICSMMLYIKMTSIGDRSASILNNFFT